MNSEIIPNQSQRTTPLFQSPQEHRAFRERYLEAVSPALEKAEEARRASWHEAQTRPVS